MTRSTPELAPNGKFRRHRTHAPSGILTPQILRVRLSQYTRWVFIWHRVSNPGPSDPESNTLYIGLPRPTRGLYLSTLKAARNNTGVGLFSTIFDWVWRTLLLVVSGNYAVLEMKVLYEQKRVIKLTFQRHTSSLRSKGQKKFDC